MASNDLPSNNTGDQTEPAEDPRADVNAAVEELLNTLSNKFAGVSSEIFAKMDEMSRRLDSLEAALTKSEAKEAANSKPQQ
ncbi:hypothetical protein S7711_03746 [Stachybotrys chartarum IBT 7711]|uniref:Heat shock factor binding protein 1 n=1 Tax=Stachybotrys chartarum (strain CBS 109288 / IBT 7711) TaxID=1280523 RepID=A0A084AWT7_STACB|nr:hypothetical protein S7711_03746 [Stachybotrys chartarum IBT 7711]KFA49465.1 hypothetical protein S40293_05776 [Stachybotrys chartarum IBT 40293]KFA78525.1 hypothetical protein S40288_01468 [Stachybotrys chartarum IBT 40288]